VKYKDCNTNRLICNYLPYAEGLSLPLNEGLLLFVEGRVDGKTDPNMVGNILGTSEGRCDSILITYKN